MEMEKAMKSLKTKIEWRKEELEASIKETVAMLENKMQRVKESTTTNGTLDAIDSLAQFAQQQFVELAKSNASLLALKGALKSLED